MKAVDIFNYVTILLVIIPSSLAVYTPVPQNFTLTNVVILLRHGDRVQITKKFGTHQYDDKKQHKFWKSKLPTESTLRSLLHTIDPSISPSHTLHTIRKFLYAGWDDINIPYGHLTELGSQQLYQVGYIYGNRYYDFIHHYIISLSTTASSTTTTTSTPISPKKMKSILKEMIYSRSTHLCRTLLSLRSFLRGFTHGYMSMQKQQFTHKNHRNDKKTIRNLDENNITLNTNTTTTNTIDTYDNNKRIEINEESQFPPRLVNRILSSITNPIYDIIQKLFIPSSSLSSPSSSSSLHSSISSPHMIISTFTTTNSVITDTTLTHSNRHIYNNTKYTQLYSSISSKPISPIVISRPKDLETMYPTICTALATRRHYLITQDYNNASNIPSYHISLQKKLSLAFQEPIPFNWLTWLNIMEILTCHSIYNVTLPPNITSKDVTLTTEFVTWVWGQLYKDKELVQLAIGRFIKEVIEDIYLSLHHHLPTSIRQRPMFFQPYASKKLRGKLRMSDLDSYQSHYGSDNITTPSHVHVPVPEERAGSILSAFLPTQYSKFLLYSGHDATMVPILVLLGIYNDEWPGYASHLTFEFASINDPLQYAQYYNSHYNHHHHHRHSYNDSNTSNTQNNNEDITSSNYTQHIHIHNKRYNFNYLKLFKDFLHQFYSNMTISNTNMRNPKSTQGNTNSNSHHYTDDISSSGTNIPLKIHDSSSTIHTSRNTKDSFYPSPPPPTTQYVIRVIYNHKPQIIPLCQLYGEWCPFDIFMDLLHMYSINHNEYKNKCST